MIRLAFGYGNGSNRIGLIVLKIAEVPPIPNASIRIAVQANPGAFRNWRNA
jgi:hypothetical protein